MAALPDPRPLLPPFMIELALNLAASLFPLGIAAILIAAAAGALDRSGFISLDYMRATSSVRVIMVVGIITSVIATIAMGTRLFG